MTTQTLPARRPSTRARHANDAGPNPVLAFVVALAVLGGGALAGLDWLDANCASQPSLATICTATGR